MLEFNTLFYRIKYIFIISTIYIFSALSNATSNLERLNVPSGFEINIFADGLESPRQITETDSGFIIVGSKMGDEIIGLFDSDCIKDAINDESIPPDKKQPNGTSDIICFFTVERNKVSVSLTASSKLMFTNLVFDEIADVTGDQYSFTFCIFF